MNESNAPRDRYLTRARALHPEGAAARSPAEILTAAGDLLRRRASLAPDLALIEGALRALPAEAIASWVGALDAGADHAALTRGAEAAALVALAEDDAERAHARSLALAALQLRDGLESAAVALEHRAALGIEGGEAARSTLAHHLTVLDRAASSRARWLVGLNDHRRPERDLLDPPARERAPWYAARLGCEGLLEALAGERATAFDDHARGCAACTADLARSRPIEAPPTPHLTTDDLLRHDRGELGPRERARVDRHVEACFDCSQALWALADGERAIDESAAGSAVGDAAGP